MVYPIFVYGWPLLRKVAAEVDKNEEGLAKLIEDMFETMYKSEGMGLAAPQIGISKRLFIVDCTALEEDDPTLKDFKKVFVNPKITKLEGDPWVYNEGCLSLPTLREDVERPSVVHLEYYDQDFNFYSEVFEGLKARVIQHEYDHIEGKLFVDYLPALRKRLLKSKLNAISKGKVEDLKYKIVPVK